MQNYHKSPEYIEDQIAETRRRFERHANEVSASLAPENMVRDALGTRSGSPADTLDALIHAAKSSPVSFALAGLGMVGLFLNKTKRPDVSQEAQLPVATDPADRTADHIRALKGQASGLAESVSDVAEDLRDKAGNLVNRASGPAQDAASSAASIGDSAYRTSVAGYKVARNRAAHAVRTAPEHGARMASDATSWARENPVPIGLAALALGAAAASFLSYRNSEVEPDDRENFPVSPDPQPHKATTPVQQKKPRKTAAVRKAVATAGAEKAKAKSAASKRSTRKSPDVSSAIPGNKSKIGKNITSSTAVLGVPENDRKS